jgi:hypothetical protein
MRTLVLVALLGACVAGDDVIVRPVEATGAGGCPAGEQPVFGPSGAPVCSPIPDWPPARTGSRAVPAACALVDGVYRLTWHRDIEDTLRPAFSVTRAMTIAGDSMALDDYRYNLDWVDAATANVWEPDDSDTWEFIIRQDCATGTVRGTYTTNLAYRTDHQIETWTLTGTP